MKSVIPWSYSSLSAFETCPRRYKLTKLTKEVSDPPGEAAMHGTAVHEALENYLNGTAPFPDKYDEYRAVADRVAQAEGERLVEWQFGLNEGLQPSTFDAPDAWVRGVIDFGVVSGKSAVLLDWKLGVPKHDHDQLKLFAAAAFATFPDLEKVRTGYVWLKYSKVETSFFRREDVPELWKEFIPRVIRLVKAQEQDKFVPKPSGLCRKHCPLTHDQCEFSGRVRA